MLRQYHLSPLSALNIISLRGPPKPAFSLKTSFIDHPRYFILQAPATSPVRSIPALQCINTTRGAPPLPLEISQCSSSSKASRLSKSTRAVIIRAGVRKKGGYLSGSVSAPKTSQLRYSPFFGCLSKYFSSMQRFLVSLAVRKLRKLTTTNSYFFSPVSSRTCYCSSSIWKRASLIGRLPRMRKPPFQSLSTTRTRQACSSHPHPQSKVRTTSPNSGKFMGRNILQAKICSVEMQAWTINCPKYIVYPCICLLII